MPEAEQLQALATGLLERVCRQGAVAADALAIEDVSTSVSVRGQNIESIEREDGRGLGLRVFVDTPKGLATASASSADVSEAGMQALADQVLAMAAIAEADPYAATPDEARHPTAEALQAWQQESLQADHEWSIEAAKEQALLCEASAVEEAGASAQSEGASAGFGERSVAYAAHDGFAAHYRRAHVSMGVSVIVGDNDAMQRDYAQQQARSVSALRSAACMGREAGARARRRMHATTMQSGKMPVVFEPRLAASLLGHLAAGLNGKAVLQGRSFLSESMHESIFPDFVHVLDDPNHEQCLANRLFDGEGSACAAMPLIANGRVENFFTNISIAKRLAQTSSGHASRGLSGDIGIAPSNLIMQAGCMPPEDILADLGSGLWLTELIGFGVNMVTGDYSRGAMGFLFEQGKITRPVHELTIAGNLRDMFSSISHIGNDMEYFSSLAVPSIAIQEMTVAA